MILVTPWSIWGNQSIGNFAVTKMAIYLTNLQHCRNRGCLFALYWLHAKKEMSLFYNFDSILWLVSFGEIRDASKMILVTPWSIWGNQSIGNFAVTKMAIYLTNLQHCRNRGCLFALYWLHAKKEMSLFYDLSTRKKEILFDEIRDASKMILVTPWSIWGNQSIGNFAVSKMAICLTNLQHCRNRGCLFALYWLHAKKEMSLFLTLITYLFWRN